MKPGAEVSGIKLSEEGTEKGGGSELDVKASIITMMPWLDVTSYLVYAKRMVHTHLFRPMLIFYLCVLLCILYFVLVCLLIC